MTTLADRILELARAEIGVHEATGGNDGAPSLRYMHGRHEPWCGHFVAYLYRRANAALPEDVTPSVHTANPLASAEHMFDVFSENDWIVTSPMPGDLVFLEERGRSDSGLGHHVGIVETVSPTALECISGNWSNAVKRHMLRRQGLVGLMGYGRRATPEGWQP
jgi:hypothetical protein